VDKVTNSATLVFPRSGRDARDAVLWSNSGLVYRLLPQVTRVLMPLKGVGSNRRDIDVSTEITRQVAKVRPLLDDRTTALIK
jgi:hypothetical protein